VGAPLPGFHQLLIFAMVAARVGTLVLIAPLFGSRSLPVQFRAALALVLALVIAPVYWHSSGAPLDSWFSVAMLVSAEILIGLFLALGLLIFFCSLELAGNLVGQVTGVAMPGVSASESGEAQQFPSALLYLVGVVVFFIAGGHRLVMAGLLDTFQTMPPGSGRLPTGLLPTLTVLLDQSFQLAVRIAAPAVLAVLCATLVTGFVSRALPQVNMWTLGYGLNMLTVLAALSLSLGAVTYVFADSIAPLFELLLRAL